MTAQDAKPVLPASTATTTWEDGRNAVVTVDIEGGAPGALVSVCVPDNREGRADLTPAAARKLARDLIAAADLAEKEAGQ